MSIWKTENKICLFEWWILFLEKYRKILLMCWKLIWRSKHTYTRQPKVDGENKSVKWQVRMYRQILLFRRIVNSSILWLWFGKKNKKIIIINEKWESNHFPVLWRIPNSFRSRKRKSSEMNKSCARCNKVVYPIEELKCLDKVCQFFLLTLFSLFLFPFQSCWMVVFYWIFPFRLATKSWLLHTKMQIRPICTIPIIMQIARNKYIFIIHYYREIIPIGLPNKLTWEKETSLAHARRSTVVPYTKPIDGEQMKKKKNNIEVDSEIIG